MTTLRISQNCTEFGQTFTLGQVVNGLSEGQEWAMVVSGLASVTQGFVRRPTGLVPVTSIMAANPAAFGLTSGDLALAAPSGGTGAGVPGGVPEDGNIFSLGNIRHAAVFGDSYIAGTGGGGLLPQLQDAMRARRVTSYAVGGQSIQHVLDVQLPAAIAAGSHDACLLWMSGNGTSSPYTDADLTLMATRMESAITTALAAGIRPVVGLHPPIAVGRDAGDLARAKSILGQLADRYGVPFFDSALIASAVTGAAAAELMHDSGHLNAIGSGLITERLRQVMDSRVSDNPYLTIARTDSTPSATARHRNAVANGLFMDAAGAFSTTGWSATNCTITAGTNVANVRGNVAKIAKSANGSMRIEAGGLWFTNTGGATSTALVYFGLRLRAISASPQSHRISARLFGNGALAEPLPRILDLPLPADGRWRTFERVFNVPAGWGGSGSNQLYPRIFVDPVGSEVTGDVFEVGQVTVRELRLT